jgi:hypothetical protein
LEVEAPRLQADAAHCAAACGGGGGGRGLDAGFGNFGGVNKRPQFFGCAWHVPIRGAADLMLMIILIIVMNREQAPMVTMVVMMLMVVLILSALEIMVTTSLVNMVDNVIDATIIMNTAKVKMVWVKLKCPFPLSTGKRMPMLILNGRPRWT